MPIYEFYCADCHTVFSFFSARIDTKASPSCPSCKRADLTRKPSRFATVSGRSEEEDTFDDSRLEGAMESLMGEMGDLEENVDDPRSAARLMRRFSDLSGLEMGDRMQEYVHRMETGEDPEALEREMEGSFGGDDASLEDFFKVRTAIKDRRSRRPKVDDELYFL